MFVSTLFAKEKTTFKENNTFNKMTTVCTSSIYTIDHLKLILKDKKEDSISILKAKSNFTL